MRWLRQAPPLSVKLDLLRGVYELITEIRDKCNLLQDQLDNLNDRNILTLDDEIVELTEAQPAKIALDQIEFYIMEAAGTAWRFSRSSDEMPEHVAQAIKEKFADRDEWRAVLDELRTISNAGTISHVVEMISYLADSVYNQLSKVEQKLVE